MGDKKHFVYSARTTEKGLAAVTKAKGDRSWDQVVNEAMASHYGIDIAVLMLPVNPETEAKKAAAAQKKADKAAAKVKREADAKQKKADKAKADKVKAADKAKADKKKAADKAKADKAKADKATPAEPAGEAAADETTS